MNAGSAAASDHLRLALTLHAALAPAAENSCLSPYSVSSALGLLTAGARGETATELAELLTDASGGLEVQARLLGESAHLRSQAGQQEPVLAVSNTLWASDELALRHEFSDELATWPAGTVGAAPFRQEPESARETINADVSERTHGLIPELLPVGAIDTDTAASLVNALYLRVAWTLPFSSNSTVDGDFHGPSGTSTVAMMAQTERFGYASRAGWQAVALPAAGETQAVVLLPDSTLAEQEGELTGPLVESLLDDLSERMVDLRLPRLRLDVRAPLTAALRDLGVRKAFTRQAELGGISDDDRLYVDSVLHQAVLRMDESGLEGAAATAAVMKLVSMPVGEPVTVHVDRPFLLLVRHVGTGAIYFLARAVRP